MSYQEPRFSYVHILRELGDDAFDSLTTAFAASAPRGLLHDNLNELLATYATDVNAIIQVHRSDQVAAGDMPNKIFLGTANRLIIPGFNKKLLCLTTLDPVGTDSFNRMKKRVPAPYSDEFETVGWISYPPNNVLDHEYERAPAGNEMERAEQIQFFALTNTAYTSDPLTLGEFYWTKVFQTTGGAVPTWNDFTVPTLRRATTRSGRTYINELGDPIRQFTLGYRFALDADRQILDAFIKAIRHGSLPFWYDHPDSGDKIIYAETFNSTAGVSIDTGNIDVALNGTGTHTSGDSLDFTTAISGISDIVFEDVAGITDFRNKIISFDLMASTPTTWLETPENFQVVVTDESIGSAWTEFDTITGYADLAEGDRNVRTRIFVDMDNEVADLGPRTPGPIADIDSIDHHLGIRVQLPSGGMNGSTLNLSNLRIIDKDKMPVYVEMTDYTREQENEIPSGGTGPMWKYDFVFTEVTS